MIGAVGDGEVWRGVAPSSGGVPPVLKRDFWEITWNLGGSHEYFWINT